MQNKTIQELDTVISPIKVVRLVLYALIFLIGMTGNVLVMIVVRARRRRRTVHDYFLLNLAIADLLYILCLPADIYIEVASFPFTEVYCKLIYPLTTFAFSLSILTLTSMAVGRCYVMQGNVSRQPIKTKIAFPWIACLWVLSLICVLPLSITVRSAFNTCLEDWPSFEYRRAYTASLLVLQYIAPLVIIGIAYIYIGVLLAQKKQPKLDNSRASHRIVINIRHRNLQIIRTLAVIVILFALLMLPHEIAWMLIDFGETQHKEAGLVLIKYSPILTYLHSCSNPLVYGLMISQFRTDAKKCICCVGLEQDLPEDFEQNYNSNKSPTRSAARHEVNAESPWSRAEQKENRTSSFTNKTTIKELLITKINEKNGDIETKKMINEDKGKQMEKQI